MALTRVTSGVIESNAVSAAKLANGSITSRTLSNTSIELKHLASSANWVGSVDTVTANVSIVQSNVNTVQANVNAQRTNVNIVSGNVNSVAANTIKNTANINLVQDNVAKVITGLTGANTNIDTVQTNVVAAESNIAAIIGGATQFTASKIFQDNVTIQGNLIVVGSQVDLGVGTATIDDNFIVVSANLTGTPATDSGIVVNRGTEGNVFIGDHIAEDGVVFALSQSPHDNATIAIQEYLDIHANAFHATSGLNFSRVHFGHRDDESTGIIADTTNNHIKFIISGTEVANIAADANLVLNDGKLTGSPNASGERNSIDMDVDEEPSVVNSVGIFSVNSIFMGLDTNNNGDSTYFGIFNDTDDLSTVTRDTATFSVRDHGEVFISDNVNVVGNANVQQNVVAQGLVYAQGTIDLVGNDYATYVSLNANINTVSQNVDSGVGLIKKVNTITSTGSSNVFFVATPTATQIPSDIEKVNVFIDGIRQKPDNPGVSNNDFVYSSVNASVTITDASLPSGLTVIVDALCPRPV